MTRFSFINLLAALLFFTTCKKPPSVCSDIDSFPDLPNGWEANSFEIPGTDSQYWSWSLRFLDANNGFRFGADSVLMATTDGGSSWVAAKTFSGEAIIGLALLDKDHIFLSTTHYDQDTSTITKGSLYRSNNGGASWEKVAFNPVGVLKNLFFLDESNGFAFLSLHQNGALSGEKFLVRTINGGLNWEILPDTKLTVPDNFTLKILPDGFGYFGSEDGKVWLTHDGGLHWKPFQTALGGFTGLQFTDPLTGYASDYWNTMIKTIDGGQTWSTIAARRTHFFRFFSSTEGLALQVVKEIEEPGITYDCKAFFSTSDGGQTWEQGQTDKHFYHHAFFFVDVNTGFVTTDAHPGKFVKLTR